jgi:hypothetical protein
MKTRSSFCMLLAGLMVVLSLNANLHAENLHERLTKQDWRENGCAENLWRRGVFVATSHGHNFEHDARQGGRIRCDCVFVRGKSKICKTSIVSEEESEPLEQEK